jgi:hypothetical protein
MDGYADLFEIVRALGPPGGLAGRLDGRQQECDEYADNRNDDQELH